MPLSVGQTGDPRNMPADACGDVACQGFLIGHRKAP
jgi:hypothetical protein